MPDVEAVLGDNTRRRFVDPVPHVFVSPDCVWSFGEERLRDEMVVSCVMVLA